mmetsp:Transcript_35793/g.76440  ORF Transcript_35793/g.76440 Transcript_35793/m.76440 type:complete len:122 (+) Transcript_35793:1-366(+)
MTSPRGCGLGNRRDAGAKCLQSIGAFQAADIVACGRLLDRMFGSAEAIGGRPGSLVDRARRVAECLMARTEKLVEMSLDAAKCRGGDDCRVTDDGQDNAPLIPAGEGLKKLARMLEEHRGK